MKFAEKRNAEAIRTAKHPKYSIVFIEGLFFGKIFVINSAIVSELKCSSFVIDRHVRDSRLVMSQVFSCLQIKTSQVVLYHLHS